MPVEPGTRQRPRLLSYDYAIALGLTLMAAVFLLTHVSRGSIPEEDASMLLRYAQNLALGHGIVWNIGEHPVEGATDFLFMGMIGILSRVTHGGVITVTRFILTACHLLTIAALYLLSRRIFRAPIWVAACLTTCMIFGTGYHFVDSCFSGPLYALFALLSWGAVLWMTEEGVTWKKSLAFSLCALLLGLTRPEGNFIALFMLAAAFYGIAVGRARLLLSFAATFLILGGAYFLWRWHYFGYLLPNPFYVKHGFGIYGGLITARILLQFLLPVWPLAGLGLVTRAGRRSLVMLALVLLPFIAMWTMMSLDNDGLNRFQYVMVPVILLSIAQIVTEFIANVNIAALSTPVRRGLAGLIAAGTVVSIFYVMHQEMGLYVNPGAYGLAMRLRPLAPRGYSMVTTEAGTLPFFSEWRVMDAMGLNDAYIAHHEGKITPEYLDTYKPELILYKSNVLGPYPPVTPAVAAAAQRMFGARLPIIDTTMRDYALAHHYTLASVYAYRLCEFHYIWVKSDGPDSARILSAVRDHPYGYQGDGAPSFDFRNSDGIAIDPCK